MPIKHSSTFIIHSKELILQVPAGNLVKVSNPHFPDIGPRLARLWVSEHVKPGVIALAPTLAYNLGIPIHLSNLIKQSCLVAAGDSTNDGALHHVLVSPCGDTEGGVSSGKQSSEANDAWRTLPQPAPLQGIRIPLADEVHIAVVREPASGWLPPSQESDGLKGGKSAVENSVAAIQSYFAAGLRAVTQGDVMAVRLPNSTDGITALLHNLHVPFVEDTVSPNGNSWIPNRVVFFRIARVVPDVGMIQVVDVTKTAVKMTGTCSSGIPATTRGYLSSQRPNPSSLGWHPSAAAMPSGWQLPYVGTLLPYWLEIARITAGALHTTSEVVPLRLAFLVHGPAGAGKRTALSAAAVALGCSLVQLSCWDLGAEAVSEEKIIEGLQAVFDGAARYRPALLVLHDLTALVPHSNDPLASSVIMRLGTALADCIARGLRENSERRSFRSPVILAACVATPEDVPAPLRRCFTHEIHVEAPDAAQREDLLRSYMGGANSNIEDMQWSDLARHTAGLLPRDLRSLAAHACSLSALQRLQPLNILEAQGEPIMTNNSTEGPFSFPRVQSSHLSEALSCARERSTTDIGAPKIPNVQWEDVGGLENVKAAILDTIELPLKHPELFSGGLRRRSGVLLYGPPGTGKTLLAKAVATECSVNFLSVKGPELINMYVGESERQVREVFVRARRARPCVIFFDELDSLAPARGRGSDSGGVMDRVVSQLLAEIDHAQGGSGTDDVFIIGATNRPDLLDPALLRPGRLDKLLYVGVADDTLSRLKVIKALTWKFFLDSGVDLEAVASKCPPRLTGADLYALCSDAWMRALKRCIENRESAVKVGQGDFEVALSTLRPSLTLQDVANYERVRDLYDGVVQS